MPSRIVRLTDDRGIRLTAGVQPLPGSVVLTEGPHGTAWQRWFSDGRWHPTRGGGSKDWAQLLTKRNLVLVYDAEERGPIQVRGTIDEELEFRTPRTYASEALRKEGA